MADANAVLDRELQNVAVRVAARTWRRCWHRTSSAGAGPEAGLHTQLDAARRRFAAGAGVRTDIDEAQARLDLTLAQELEARQNVDFTRRQLQVLVIMPVDALAPVDEAQAGVAPAGPQSP